MIPPPLRVALPLFLIILLILPEKKKKTTKISIKKKTYNNDPKFE